MKKATLILILALATIKAAAQAPLVQWERSLGGSSVDQANAVKPTPDSGYIVACVTQSTDGDVTLNHGLYDAWIVKLSSFGSIVWQRSYGGSGSDVPYAVQQTTDGGYVFAAKSNSVDGDVTGNHGGDDFWIVKTDDDGAYSVAKIIWRFRPGCTTVYAANNRWRIHRCRLYHV